MSATVSIYRKHSIEPTVRRSPLTLGSLEISLRAQWLKSTKKLQRKKTVENLCCRIRFDQVRLLRDTVTEIALPLRHDVTTTRQLASWTINTEPAEVRLCSRWF